MTDSPITQEDREAVDGIEAFMSQAHGWGPDSEFIAQAIANARAAGIASVVGDRLDAFETGRTAGVQEGREEAAVECDKRVASSHEIAEMAHQTAANRRRVHDNARAVESAARAIRSLTGDKT